MVCQSCVNTIKSVLEETSGVESVEISLDDGQALVGFTHPCNERAIIDAIEDCGFEAALIDQDSSTSGEIRAVVVEISGMVCQSCVNTIESQLQDTNGVSKFSVSLAENSAVVSFNPSVTSAKEIVDRIEDCGFDASIKESSKSRPKPKLENPFKDLPLSNDDDNSDLLSPSATMIQLESLPLYGQNRQETVKLRIKGMTCASCVNSIERHLRTLNGIRGCSVALLSEEAEITFDPEFLSAADICEQVDSIGFFATVVQAESVGTLNLRIQGMSCSSCSSKIERELSKTPGIRAISINLLGQSGKVKFDKEVVGVRDIVEKIESLGFSASIGNLGDSAQIESLNRTKEIRNWKNAFFVSLLFSLPVSLISMVFPMVIPAAISTPVIPGLSLGDFMMLLLTIPVQFIVGKRFYVSSFKSLRHGVATMDVLVALGKFFIVYF